METISLNESALDELRAAHAAISAIPGATKAQISVEVTYNDGGWITTFGVGAWVGREYFYRCGRSLNAVMTIVEDDITEWKRYQQYKASQQAVAHAS